MEKLRTFWYTSTHIQDTENFENFNLLTVSKAFVLNHYHHRNKKNNNNNNNINSMD
jgi:hypothetical protein